MLSSPNTREAALIALALLVLVVSGGDVIDDLAHGADRAHLALELVMMTLAGGSVVALLRELARRGHELAALKQELAASPEPAEAGARELRHQLGVMIHDQFRTWNLTASEQAVGWLLLKGLSPDFSHVSCCGRRSARKLGPCSQKPPRHTVKYAFVAFCSARPDFAASRRPRDGHV